MGDSHSPSQSPPHERGHDVHVGQQSADLQHHDGVHAVQEPDTKLDADEPSVHEVRDGGHKEDDMAD